MARCRAPDEAEDLHAQRGERDHVDQCQDAQEKPLLILEAGRFDARSEGEARSLVEEIAVVGDEAVQPLGEPRDRARRCVYAAQVERIKHGFGVRHHRSVFTHQLHAFGERLTRNLRVLVAHLLRGRVIDTIPAERLPVIDPDFAEAAVAVVDEERFRGSCHRHDARKPTRLRRKCVRCSMGKASRRRIRSRSARSLSFFRAASCTFSPARFRFDVCFIQDLLQGIQHRAILGPSGRALAFDHRFEVRPPGGACALRTISEDERDRQAPQMISRRRFSS